MEKLLFVCTGNICRSAMAEAFASSRLQESSAGVSVSSAGFLDKGLPSTREAREVMFRRGFDISSHRSKHLGTALEEKPDLVICMTRQHLRKIVDMDPDLLSKTFTLKELDGMISSHGPRLESENLSEYLDRLGRDRKISQLSRLKREDDISDPIGRSVKHYEACASEIQTLVDRLLSMVWPVTDKALLPPR